MTADDHTAFLQNSMPLCKMLGIRCTDLRPEQVVLELDWAEELCTSGPIMHGGAVMALADSAGGAAAFANLPDGAVGTSTIESKTNFLGGVKSGTLVATARPLHIGSTTIVIETELRNNGKLVGKTTQTQSVLRPRP